jgi:hypothetical protein
MIIIIIPLYLWLTMAADLVDVLEIVREDSVDTVYWTQVKPGYVFSLGYIHSVQLCPVLDSFKIDRNRSIILVSTTFSDHGAGLPTYPYRGADFSVQDDGSFKISNMNIFLPEIRLRVGKEYNNIFIHGSHQINLSKAYGDALLIVRTRELSAFRCQLRRLLNVG